MFKLYDDKKKQREKIKKTIDNIIYNRPYIFLKKCL